MGEVRVPEGALYGPQTQRAVEHFPISGMRFQRSFIGALGLIKAAAAKVNGDLGELPPRVAAAVEAAANQETARTIRNSWWISSRPATALRRT